MSFAASVLRSGATLAQAGHVAALIASVGWFQTKHPLLAASLLVWLFHCYIALRVAIDAGLFVELVGREEQFDQWRMQFGLTRSVRPRSLEDRTRGALRLWKLQIVAFGLQALFLGLGMLR